ncbi:MAG: hypothetical protein JNM14_04310 [Ferruginibacter sp.]|nr:hypothetical protein [Ferruginibacter sp.]
MPETLSVQSGYILESPATSSENAPIKFEKFPDGSLKLTCEIIIPKNSQGLKFNPTVKPNDPDAWEFGEIELPLKENISTGGNHKVFLTGIGGELSLNIRAKLAGKKVWSLPNKVWSMQ